MGHKDVPCIVIYLITQQAISGILRKTFNQSREKVRMQDMVEIPVQDQMGEQR